MEFVTNQLFNFPNRKRGCYLVSCFKKVMTPWSKCLSLLIITIFRSFIKLEIRVKLILKSTFYI